MSAATFIVGLALILATGFFVLWPLIAGWKQRGTLGQTADLEIQLMQMVKSIRDLDFDYDTGKIETEDYIEQRKLFIGRGVSLLIRLDEAQKLDTQIEEMVAAYRQGAK